MPYSPFHVWVPTHLTPSKEAAHWPYLIARELLDASLATAMPAVLEQLGHVGAADRVYVIEYDEGLRQFRNTHEWIREGVHSHVDELQSSPVALLGGIHSELLAGRAVAVSDVRYMPEDAVALQQELLRRGNKSVLCVPLMLGGKLRGLFGFEATRHHQVWGAETVAAMFRCAELLAMALHGDARRAAPLQARQSSSLEPLIYARNGTHLQGVPLDSVLAVRAQRNASELLLADGALLPDARPIKHWQALLPALRFARVHRSLILRVAAIRELVRRPSGRWHVLLGPAGMALNVSRDAVDGLRRQLELQVSGEP